MIGNRLYVAHKTNNLLVSYIEAMNEKKVATEEYLSINSGVYSVRGIQVVSMQNPDSIRGIPRMYLMVDVALLAYDDSRTNSEFKVVATTMDGTIIPDTNREVTSRFQYELSADELKEAIDGGLYDSAVEYEAQLTEQLRSTIFKDDTASIRVRMYELEQEQIIRIVSEHSYLTKISPKQNSELARLLKVGMEAVTQMNREGKRYEVELDTGVDLVVEPNGEIVIDLDDILETDAVAVNTEYNVILSENEEVKEVEINKEDKLNLDEIVTKVPVTSGAPTVEQKKRKVDSGLEF